MQHIDNQRVIHSVNLLANAYAGSNPALPTIFNIIDRCYFRGCMFDPKSGAGSQQVQPSFDRTA